MVPVRLVVPTPMLVFQSIVYALRNVLFIISTLTTRAQELNIVVEQKTSNIPVTCAILILEGHPAFFIVLVRKSLQPSHVIHAISNPESAGEAGVEEKDLKHDEVLKCSCSSIFHYL